jgi:hypothetical protein
MAVDDIWAHEETDDALYPDQRNFYKIAKAVESNAVSCSKRPIAHSLEATRQTGPCRRRISPALSHPR